jgi:hypothetical protein
MTRQGPISQNKVEAMGSGVAGPARQRGGNVPEISAVIRHPIHLDQSICTCTRTPETRPTARRKE